MAKLGHIVYFILIV